MDNWILSYRVYGPAQIGAYADIGEGRLVPRSSQSNETAELRYTISASDEKEARKLATTTYRDRAQSTVNCLSFILGDGLTLGPHHDPRLEGDKAPRITAGASVAFDFVLSVADQMVDTVESLANKDEYRDRPLRWYNLGLSSINPEDSFVAFWTGLEASFKSSTDLSDSREKIYKEAKSKLDSIDTDDEEFRERLKNNMGNGKREYTSDSIADVLVTETEHTHESLDQSPTLSDMVGARGNIVHSGKEVDSIDELAARAQNLLRDLLDSRFGDAYHSLLDGEVTDVNSDLGILNTEPLLDAVFEGEVGKTLTVEEIQRQAYGLTRDIHGALDIQTYVQNYSGWNRPLHQISEIEYRYAPLPDWITTDGDAILRYLDGAGWVPTEIIVHNVNKGRRPDFDRIDAEKVESECTKLARYEMVETDDEFYSITQDGSMCIEGRLDPNQLTKFGKE